MTDTHGTFVWYELVTSDVQSAIAFYTNVIGWGSQQFQAGNPYVLWMAGSNSIGGVMALQDEQRKRNVPPHWFAHVAVDDVDACAKQAESLGGKIVTPPTDIPTVGRFSIIADPHGAFISLFKGSGSGPAMPTEVTNGRFSWHELMAGDREAALDFYGKLFGWQKTDAVTSPMGTYQMYGKGGRTFGGMMNRPKDYPAPPHWLYYVNVADLDAALERVKPGGGKVLNGPMEVPGGDRVAQCQDPQGAFFALHGK